MLHIWSLRVDFMTDGTSLGFTF